MFILCQFKMINMETADATRCGEEKYLWFLPDSKWNHHIFHAKVWKQNITQSISVEYPCSVVLLEKTKPQWTTDTWNLQELHIPSPADYLLSTVSQRATERSFQNTRTTVTLLLMIQLRFSRSVCFCFIPIQSLELEIAPKGHWTVMWFV